LKSAVAGDVEREVLRRLEGPVVPLRGFRVSGCDRDLESEIRALRLRGEQVAAAREVALADLEPEEVERLLALARS
jgi:DNA-binding GntR family transcriptional regulator